MPRRVAAGPIRIAVLGWWHVHAPDYAAAAREHPECEVVGVWDHDAGLGAEGAAALGVPHADDLDALLGREDVDAVTVTTETTAHRDVILRAAAAGKHVFSEKVLAPRVAEAEEIIEATDAAGVALVVSLPRLYHGSTLAVDEVLASGVLGTLTYGRVRLSHDGASAGWLPERFYDPETAVGGALTDLGCHPVYLIQRWLGARPESVTATYRSLTGRAVEDHAVVTVGYADGRIGAIETGFVSQAPFTIELHGTDAVLHYADPPGALRVLDREGASSRPVPPDGEDAFAQWVRHMRNGTRADDNLARSLDLTRLVVAANESAATGRTVVPGTRA